MATPSNYQINTLPSNYRISTPPNQHTYKEKVTNSHTAGTPLIPISFLDNKGRNKTLPFSFRNKGWVYPLKK